MDIATALSVVSISSKSASHFHVPFLAAAAPAEATTSNLPLVIALVGILGTLTASFMTQWLASRRDDKQWSRQKQLQNERIESEREQERTRWERERAERKQQWAREDSARWNQERMSAYAVVLVKAEEWLAHANEAQKFLEPQAGYAPPELTARLKMTETEIGKARTSIELVGGSEPRFYAFFVWTSAMAFTRRLEELPAPTGNGQAESVARRTSEGKRALEDMSNHLQKFRLEIRSELGIENSRRMVDETAAEAGGGSEDPN